MVAWSEEGVAMVRVEVSEDNWLCCCCEKLYVSFVKEPYKRGDIMLLPGGELWGGYS